MNLLKKSYLAQKLNTNNMFELLVATTNENKIKEIKQILEPHDIKVYGMKDFGFNVDPEENGTTYKENAIIKAIALSKFSSLPIIADDSGIEIEALNNEPGIHTARFAKSLGGYDKAFEVIMAKVKETDNNKALFNCDIALVNVEKDPIVFEGRVHGTIASHIEGINGFGFDPIFVSDKTGKANALLSEKDKNNCSARGAALAKLISYLKNKKLCN